MSKLKTIRDNLEANPEAIIVEYEEELSSDSNARGWKESFLYHMVQFHVAPKDGIYTASGLQTFMLGLVSALHTKEINSFGEPVAEDRATRSPNCFLSLGSIIYCEKVGEEKMTIHRKITLSDEELRDTTGFVNGKKIINTSESKKYERAIVIKVYPNEKLAQEFLASGKAALYVHLNTLVEYRPELECLVSH